jgi:hypothetical protein
MMETTLLKKGMFIMLKLSRMKKIILIFLICSSQIKAQELFVFSEPASNMPTGSLGIRMGQSLMKESFSSGYNYHLMPEIMFGINKNLMLHTTAFVSNRSNNLVTEGGSLYAKYRFLSLDDLHAHFRMAFFGRFSRNNSDIHQEEIETMGHNSGYELGFIATKLAKKIAINASFSFEKAMDNKPNFDFPNNQSNNASNYTFSIGKLVYPKQYSSLKQTNLNVMLEVLGQNLNQNGKSFLDIAPSLQFIILSQARIDLAYRQQLYSSMLRTAPNGIYLKMEYIFFNIKK